MGWLWYEAAKIQRDTGKLEFWWENGGIDGKEEKWREGRWRDESDSNRKVEKGWMVVEVEVRKGENFKNVMNKMFSTYILEQGLSIARDIR